MQAIARIPFFAGYRSTFTTGALPLRLSRGQVEGLEALLSFMEADHELADVRHAAYMLATVKHECADTWQPIEERGNVAYFRQYEPGTSKGRRLGNTHVGDGALYKGRGYAMITGRANYAKFGIEHDPLAALEPATAYRILSEGMRLGRFTGRRLSQHIATTTDYRGARRIINGLDRAELIAGYAERFERILSASVVVSAADGSMASAAGGADDPS